MPKVSTYSNASTPLGDADVFYVVQGGNSRKTTVGGLKTVLAPLPKSAGGVGQWAVLSSGIGLALILPAGGTWAWFYVAVNASGQIISHAANVGAGGATVGSAIAGVNYLGFAWRVS